MQRSFCYFLVFWCVALASLTAQGSGILVFLTDFGLQDSAVCEMKGVAMGVDPNLKLHDVTHAIEPFNVWEGSYRLKQAAPYWPQGTVFVAVVDPGVGTARKSIVLKSKSGHYFVGPDNGLFTLVAEEMGIAEVREIDEARHRRQSSENSYTFWGRDVFSYTGAKLASGKIVFTEVGPVLDSPLVMAAYQKPRLIGELLLGNIPVLDVQYGNVWTNIDQGTLASFALKAGDPLAVKIFCGENLIYDGRMPFVRTFGDVKEGEPLAYVNSLLNLAFALNMDSFARKHKISAGANWHVTVGKPK
jgi:S-adenosylmethionine hydrolase